MRTHEKHILQARGRPLSTLKGLLCEHLTNWAFEAAGQKKKIKRGKKSLSKKRNKKSLIQVKVFEKETCHAQVLRSDRKEKEDQWFAWGHSVHHSRTRRVFWCNAKLWMDMHMTGRSRATSQLSAAVRQFCVDDTNLTTKLLVRHKAYYHTEPHFVF